MNPLGGFSMAAPALPCPTLLRLLISYDPATGEFTWKVRPRFIYKKTFNNTERMRRIMAQRPAFRTQDGNGYLICKIRGRQLLAHRVAWAIMHGSWPSGMIDHIDGNGENNKWSNLRLADHSQNGSNSQIRSDNKTGFRGVSWNGRDRKWQAMISHRGKQFNLGVYADQVDAANAYDAAARRLHGQYARVNFP
jgi:hypothetical protein